MSSLELVRCTAGVAAVCSLICWLKQCGGGGGGGYSDKVILVRYSLSGIIVTITRLIYNIG